MSHKCSSKIVNHSVYALENDTQKKRSPVGQRSALCGLIYTPSLSAVPTCVNQITASGSRVSFPCTCKTQLISIPLLCNLFPRFQFYFPYFERIHFVKLWSMNYYRDRKQEIIIETLKNIFVQNIINILNHLKINSEECFLNFVLSVIENVQDCKAGPLTVSELYH